MALFILCSGIGFAELTARREGRSAARRADELRHACRSGVSRPVETRDKSADLYHSAPRYTRRPHGTEVAVTTYGFDRVTGIANDQTEMSEADIYAGILQALGVSTTGANLPNVPAMCKPS